MTRYRPRSGPGPYSEATVRGAEEPGAFGAPSATRSVPGTDSCSLGGWERWWRCSVRHVAGQAADDTLDTSGRAVKINQNSTDRVVHWNPTRPRFRGTLGRYVQTRVPVNNFGDLLGPAIVAGELTRRGLGGSMSRRLLAVGSILHFARDGDVVWGAGVNGKIPADSHEFGNLDIRAVRGPRSREFLRARSIDVPAVYGDPGLLLPYAMPEALRWREKTRYQVTVVPNLNEVAEWKRVDGFLDPRDGLKRCVRRIARSGLVVGSSLHGIVTAEALGIPARLIISNVESDFKYADYYEGTGRADYKAANSLAEALTWGGERPPRWSPEPLLEAFPEDIWQ